MKRRKVLLFNASKPFYNLAIEKLRYFHRKDNCYENVDIFSPEFDIAYFSAIFSWDVPFLVKSAKEAKTKQMLVGGPGVSVLGSYILNETGTKAHIGLLDIIERIKLPQPKMAFTSRGCIRNCPFCLVPKIEEFQEYKDFQVARKIQDNNFLACSKEHRLKVYKQLENLSNIDFNQGLDVRLFTHFDLDKMMSLKMQYYRFAFDSLSQEASLRKAILLLKRKGVSDWRKIPVYILYGFREFPEEAFYRIETVIKLGARPFVMPYKPLDWLKKETYYVNLEKGWSSRLMMHIARFYNKVWLYTGGKADIKEYMKNHKVKEFEKLKF